MRGPDLSILKWEPVADAEESQFLSFTATDDKGKKYALVKNERTPECMFAMQAGTMKVMPGWYKQQPDGSIRRIS